MTTVHDPTIKEYTYFDRIKRPEISLKFVVNTETVNVINSTNSVKFTCPVSFMNPVNSVLFTCSVLSTNSMSPVNSVFSVFSTNFTLSTSVKNKLQYLQKLYVLEHYNKEMSDSDNYTKLNSYNSVSRHYHRRN